MPIMAATAGDMLAAAPADLFAGIDDISPSGETVDDSPFDDSPADDPPADDAPEDPGPAEGDAPASGDTPAETPVKAAKGEDLPEGVIKTKDDKGKYKYNLDENRYKTVYGNHQLVQQAAQALGEPVTLDALKLRNEAYLAQERLFSTLESGDPKAQGQAISFMLDEMKTAHQNGAVGVDPTVPFAESVYATLSATDPNTGELLHPAAYDNLRWMGARDLVTDMFNMSARTGDENLFHSARRVVAAITGMGEKPADMPAEEYLAAVRQAAEQRGVPFPDADEWRGLSKPAPRIDPKDRTIAELRARLNQTQGPGPAERYGQWRNANRSEVNTAIMTDAVKPSLSSVEAGWSKFPDDYKRLVVDPLNREVVKALTSDRALDQQVTELQQRAKRATSPQVLNQIGAQIKDLFVHRAKLAADQVKKPIVDFAADWLKGRSDTTHERRAGSQDRTQPKGTSTPVKQSLLPTEIVGMKNNVFDPKIGARQAAALLANMR